MNHPFIDGDKRIAHAAMAVFLDLKGLAIEATVDEQEHVMLRLAAGQIALTDLTTWLESHVSSDSQRSPAERRDPADESAGSH
jgi:death-on-curing protein